MNASRFLQANLDALSRRDPALAEWARAIEHPANVRVVDTPCGEPSAEVTLDDGGRVALHSRRDPRREAVRATENAREGRVWFCVGMGLGYHAEELLRLGDARRRVLIVEPDAGVFRAALGARDITPLLDDARAAFAVCGSPFSLDDLLAEFLEREWVRDRAQRLRLPACHRVNPAVFDEACERIETACARFNAAVDTHYAMFRAYRRNHLRNLPLIARAPPVTGLAGKMKGVPAICVASGPSLDRNVRLAPEMARRAVIIAVDSALPPLASVGVVPDFACTVDLVPHKAALLREYDSRSTPLLAMEDAHPDLLAAWRGPRFLAGRGSELSRFLARHLPERGAYPEEMTVANFAFSMATLLGCEPVIFAGLDLALAPEGMHASGVPETWGFPDAMERISVRGAVLPRVETLPNLLVAARAMSSRIADWGGRFIDATEGGMYIRGSEVRPMAEVLTDLDGDVPAPLERLRRNPLPASDAPGGLGPEFRAEAAEIEKRMRGVCLLAIQALRALGGRRDRALGAPEAREAQRLVDEIRKRSGKDELLGTGMADAYIALRDIEVGAVRNRKPGPVTPRSRGRILARSALRAANLLRREFARATRET